MRIRLRVDEVVYGDDLQRLRMAFDDALQNLAADSTEPVDADSRCHIAPPREFREICRQGCRRWAACNSSRPSPEPASQKYLHGRAARLAAEVVEENPASAVLLDLLNATALGGCEEPVAALNELERSRAGLLGGCER